MRKVKFENRYGQFQAVINETKKQFRQVEKNLMNYLTLTIHKQKWWVLNL